MQIALISPTTIWERQIRKLTGFTDRHRQALQRIRARVWWFYGDLKAYCRDGPGRSASFARILRLNFHPWRCKQSPWFGLCLSS